MVSTNELLNSQRKLTNLHDRIQTKISENNTSDDYQDVINATDAVFEEVLNWMYDNVKTIEMFDSVESDTIPSTEMSWEERAARLLDESAAKQTH